MPHQARLVKSRLLHSLSGSPERAGEPVTSVLLEDLRDPTGADGAATLTDRELEAFLHGDRLNQLNRHRGVVARHNHLGALGQRDNAGNVRGPEVELRTVV